MRIVHLSLEQRDTSYGLDHSPTHRDHSKHSKAAEKQAHALSMDLYSVFLCPDDSVPEPYVLVCKLNDRVDLTE